MNWEMDWKGLRRPEKTRRKREEIGWRELSEVTAEVTALDADGEEESSSEITQSTRTITLSTRGTRELKRFETKQHLAKALTSPMLLKTKRRTESGIRSK